MTECNTGIIVGYDPGGDGAHGVALLSIDADRTISVATETFKTTEAVIAYMERLSPLLALGVDTLTCWSTGPGGWRPADRWLRARYQAVRNSVMTPNGLAGSMGINGMSVLLAMRRKSPQLIVVETHPKVLYWALERKKYNYASGKIEMEKVLCDAHAATVATANEHEWDAAISAFAAACGVRRRWTNDLHTLPTAPGERLISPCGATNYYWPES